MDRLESATRWAWWWLRGRPVPAQPVPSSLAMSDGSSWPLAVRTGDDAVRLSVTAPDGSVLTGEASGAWDALRQLRLRLEARGLVPCCAGARVDACVSGMGRDMGGGWLVSLVRPGRPARRCDLADLFEPASAQQVATVAEQDAFHERWLASLGGR